ncbi:unnamed protein product [Vitrella brassicaformis CCMP3155]|uniref:Histone acetyltransferase n=2 Tax=Vitrella brassicaformis TaxID=1169539 RepID=A0A0G4EUH8_VITBC|nr:unnamed protein product [Vitrella brassicaformis CCMP3155]|mmetsp:Transcript_50767/g.127371  ORF Transcript_50767/g.127371 Transcript_50767/m.127371 type:complete len:560 (+) Transcript_50767:59-1738(+)|eukprot:CEM01955.1 unnamed protein product [Vitrella brassicaformis CCMP3155]
MVDALPQGFHVPKPSPDLSHVSYRLSRHSANVSAMPSPSGGYPALSHPHTEHHPHDAAFRAAAGDSGVNLAPPDGHWSIEVDMVVSARFQHRDFEEAVVLDKRLKPGHRHTYEYYVHYKKHNRRLDTWLTAKHIRPRLGYQGTPSVRTDADSDLPEPARPNKKKSEKKHNGKRKLDALSVQSDGAESSEHEGMDRAALQQHEQATRVKTITRIQFGKYLMDTWYFSPFPPEYQKPPANHGSGQQQQQQQQHAQPCHPHHSGQCCGTSSSSPSKCRRVLSGDMGGHEGEHTLYFCEFCLSFYRYQSELQRHSRYCSLRHPPGDEIYRKDNLSVFEVDGYLAKVYCENLCYLAKLFLDHKTLQYDVEPFLFYVLCEYEEGVGYHLVGYFSKEKRSAQDYNVACILTLPQHQRKGYGKFLIQFSYELNLLENKTGSPEKPLSDLGKASYRAYWTQVLLPIIDKADNSISIEELSRQTAIKAEDIEKTLKQIGVLKYFHGQYILTLGPGTMERLLREAGKPGVPVDRSALHWTPWYFAPPKEITPDGNTLRRSPSPSPSGGKE